jgi:Cu+-exporting ATPase
MEDKAAPVLDGQMPLLSPPPQPQTIPSTVRKAAVEEKTKDLVCGMTVNPDHAMDAGLTVELEGTTYYFCSEDCKAQFTRNPLRYLTEKAVAKAPVMSPDHGEQPHD